MVKVKKSLMIKGKKPSSSEKIYHGMIGHRETGKTLKKTQVFHRIVQIGLYFTNERHFEGKLGFLELLSIKFESFSQ